MKSLPSIFLITVLILGCTAPRPGNPPQGRIVELSSVEQMEFGKATGTDARRVLGEPNQIIELKQRSAGLNENDAWIYREMREGQPFDRLGLLVDRKTGIIQSATWSIRENDALKDKVAAIAYFNGASFVKQEIGQVAADYYSDDLTFTDQKRGITLLVNGARQTVRTISFEIPKQPTPP